MGEVAAGWLRRAAAIAVVISIGACSLGDKEQVAERATRAREVATGPRAAEVSLELRPRQLPAAAEQVPGAALGGVYAGARGEIDAKRGMFALFAPDPLAARINALTGGTAPNVPLLFASRHAVTVRRPAREVVAARAWYRLELERAREVVKPTASTLFTPRNASDLAVLTPPLMIDLLAGVLAGSVKQSGRTITGRLSLDKANREDDLDDDAIEARRDALRLFAVVDDVHEFTLRLAPDGSIAALVIEMVMKPDRQVRVDLTWRLEVGGRAQSIAAPKLDETVRVTSFNQLKGAITGWAA